jgi:sugar phosphate isomerase/epimerase
MDNLQAYSRRQDAAQFTDRLAVSSWCWHSDYYDGSWSLLDLPGATTSTGLSAIECNDFMLPPPRLSRLRRPLFSLLPGAPPELWRYSRATMRQLLANSRANQTKILAWTINSDFTVPVHHWPAQHLYLWRGLAAARLLQTPLLRLNLGGAAETPDDLDGVVVQRLTKFATRSLSRYPALNLTVENHWGVSTDIDRHLTIIDQVAARLLPSLRQRFGCCFDPANMPNDSRRDRWWRQLAARANHFHLKTKEFNAAGEETSLPYPYLFDLLGQAGFPSSVTIEFAGDGPAAEGVRKSINLFEATQDRPQPITA